MQHQHTQPINQAQGSPSRRRSLDDPQDEQQHKRARHESNGLTVEMMEERMRQKDEQIAMMQADAEKRAADQVLAAQVARRQQEDLIVRTEQALAATNKAREEEALKAQAEKERIEQLQVELARLAEERSRALLLSEAEKSRLAQETQLAQAQLAEAQAKAEESRKMQEQQEAKESKLKEEFQCSICVDYIFDGLLLSCSHSFCRECLMGWMRSNHSECPNCRVQIPFMYEPVPTLSINNSVEMLLEESERAEFQQRKADKAKLDAENKKSADTLRRGLNEAMERARRAGQALALLQITTPWPAEDKAIFTRGIAVHMKNDEARAVYLSMVGLTRESIQVMDERSAVVACNNLGIADWIAPSLNPATGRVNVITPQVKLAELRRRLWLFHRFGVQWTTA